MIALLSTLCYTFQFLGGFVKNVLIVLLLGITVFPSEASAACLCRCVNGAMLPLCQTAIELPPICPPTVCQIVPPSIAPIQMPYIPPIGTAACRMVQVQNGWSGRYEWRQVCR